MANSNRKIIYIHILNKPCTGYKNNLYPSFQVRNFQYLGMSQEKTLDGDRQVKDKGLGMTDECQEHSLDREMIEP